VPVARGEYRYYSRTEKGKQYPIWCRRRGESGAEEMLLDGNVLAQGQKYFQLGKTAPSPDQKLFAYGTDTEGNEELTIQVKNLETGAVLPDRITKAEYSLAWAADNKTFFYTVRDAAQRPYKVMRHILGTGSSQDVEIYHEKDERFTVSVEESRSREYIFLSLDSQTTSEVRWLKADKPDGRFEVILPRQQDVEYDVVHRGSSLFYRISDTGKTFRLVEAPVSDPANKSKWKELIPARPDITIEDLDAYRDHLVSVDRDQGLRRIRVRKFSTGEEHFVTMPESSYTAYPGGDVEFDTNIMRFVYTSLVTPMSIYDYNMDDRTRVLRKQQPVLGGYDPSQYVTERIAATASDGAKVPISIVYRKGLKRDGTSPALLYAYGSYGAPSDPTFSSDRLSLLNRGFVFAIAHIRGGGDLGKLWHEEGRMLKKRNTFTDFIASAEELVRQKYTTPKRLGIMGGSAGGLLMGAVVNMRPDLFGGVIAKVPFVDVINTMMDTSLPLTVSEFEEWGNPEDPKFYSYMRSYSPYDNVERQVFPNMLVTGGLNDPRVSYWEPAKWVAKLRTLKKGDNILLLKTNMGAGHFGASGRYDRLKETAFDYAFLFKALGVPAN
jgi:oligopeptidase B